MGNRSSSKRVWIVRHGERVDEVDRSWARLNPSIHHDPPLTSKGKVDLIIN
jgi:broad specificity phosphatase PhoE